ncbi:MAG: diaminopimelate decarboxylase [Dongiaceae bacterium]
MSAFAYRDGTLHAEGVQLARIAAEVGTPFYCYSSGALTAQYRAFAAAFAGRPATICYALKANANLAVVATLAGLGAGADVVSGGELRQALRAGIPAQRIVFAGVGKTRAEMATALAAGILQFNVESMPELEALNEVAIARGTRAPVALRVNPDVDPRTHAKIATGKAENKFGVDLGQARAGYCAAASMPGIEVTGVAVHIGSQLMDLEPYRAAFARVAELAGELRRDGHDIRRLDLGGGLGIAYGEERAPDLGDYARLVGETVGRLGCALVFEPGRFLVGNAGVLVTRVLYVKEGASRCFVIVDAGMNDLLRPTLYEAYHAILPVARPASDAASRRVDIVGPVCESADSFATQRALPPVAPGDLLAICSAGAYGAVMSSTYNLRLPAPEVMVRGDDHAVVRPRPDYDTMLGADRLPRWMTDGAAEATPGAATRRLA